MRDETRKFLDKAVRAIRAAETLLPEGEADFAAGRATYSGPDAIRDLGTGHGSQEGTSCLRSQSK
jgi:hypothetical protein